MSLIIKNLAKSFGTLSVLNQLSFEVKPHDIIVIMGASGIGKSTLLRCICKLEKEDSGEIILDNIRKEDSQYSQKIGLVFQNFNLFPHKTVFNNCLEPLKIKKIKKNEAEKIVMEYLDLLRIKDKKDQYPFQLSGGQKQRVAIARACCLNPSYLCFDEPTSSLDEDSINDISTIIKQLAERGMGVIVVTHDKNFARTIRTRIIEL